MHFTEDHQVVAVVSGALQNDTEAFRTCMAKHEVPVIAMGAQPFDDRVFTATKGFYHHLFPMWNRLAPVLVDRLVAQKYFTKWDATSGRPGSAPVKIGLLAVDSPIGHRVAALVDRELARVGHKATTTFYYTDVSTLDAAGAAVPIRRDHPCHLDGSVPVRLRDGSRLTGVPPAVRHHDGQRSVRALADVRSGSPTRRQRRRRRPAGARRRCAARSREGCPGRVEMPVDPREGRTVIRQQALRDGLRVRLL